MPRSRNSLALLIWRNPFRTHFGTTKTEKVLTTIDHSSRHSAFGPPKHKMSSLGPQLPPHMIPKRKREEDDTSSSPKSASHSRSSSADSASKRRRIIGPALPPAPLAERPSTPPSPAHSTSSSDDDFGPSLPPAPGSHGARVEAKERRQREEEAAGREAAKKPQREEWMLVPPTQDDWSSRVDPTKLKNRKFNTGKGSKAPASQGGNDNTVWTETPEQKRKRLEDEVMGVKKPAQLGPEDKRSARDEAERRETDRRIREYNEKNRGQSLYKEHAKQVPKEKADDPSARAFDREKDMALGGHLGEAKKREMVRRAGDFGSRFEKGNYL